MLDAFKDAASRDFEYLLGMLLTSVFVAALSFIVEEILIGVLFAVASAALLPLVIAGARQMMRRDWRPDE